MMKVLLAALLLFTLAACSPVLNNPAKPASSATSGKPLPYAPPPPRLPDEVVAAVDLAVTPCDEQPVALFSLLSSRGPPSRPLA